MLKKKAVELVSVMGGLLIQEQDTVVENDQAWQVVTERQPTPERDALNFAWKAVKHVKSNAIVLANESQTVGIGAGQMNRIGSVKLQLIKPKQLENYKGPSCK